eukprot:TRINITY_DN15183_c0_g1_i1.p1 TRINITY_DN15183_c0_g1~~TRINITY_DN15183_c0_g1_i1.p1  ORF type:complete len:458 (+),score=64.29 TRINITY_DN15183_c0_g1_i1:208-1581(+)
MASSTIKTIPKDAARKFLIHHLRLNKDHYTPDAAGARALLEHLRCIQLDSITSSGSTNHEMTIQARMELGRGEMWDAFRGNTFEHWAKQRCILPESAFANYYFASLENRIPENSFVRQAERKKLCPQDALDKVYKLVSDAGDSGITLEDLPDYGTIEIPWYSSTGKAKISTFALEILWQDLKVAIVGREASSTRMNPKIHKLVEVAFPNHVKKDAKPKEPFDEWLLQERVWQSGLFPMTNSQPVWCGLEELKRSKSTIFDDLVASGRLERIQIGDEPRIYLAPANFMDLIPKELEFDDRVRIIAPLDQIVWDREIVRQLWNFDVLWEASKPPAKRIWGHYICLLFYKGDFVGRLDLKGDKTKLNLRNIWLNESVPRGAVYAAIERHARLNRLTIGTGIDKSFPQAKLETRRLPAAKEDSQEKPSVKRRRTKSMEDDQDEDGEEEPDKPSKSKRSKTK